MVKAGIALGALALALVAVSPAGAVHLSQVRRCPRQRGPRPLPAPGSHRCATTVPGFYLCLPHFAPVICYFVPAPVRSRARPR